MNDRLLVVAAHLGDAIWRCGGTVAKYCKNGNPVKVIVLSYGLRGESNTLWKNNPEQTIDNARRIRAKEGDDIMRALGVTDVEFWDLEDYPLETSTELTVRLAEAIRVFRPTVMLTHDRNRDVFNQDHGIAAELVWRANVLASVSGIDFHGHEPVMVSRVYGFEPHMPDLSSFKPDVYIDITDVMETKNQAMQRNVTQKGLIGNYVAKAEMRANHFRRLGGHGGCKYAECFSSFYPEFREWL